MVKINQQALVMVLAAVLVLVGGYFAFISTSDKDQEQTTISQPQTTQTNNTNSNPLPPPEVKPTEQLLLYLIEEEKLAHDVYTVMHQKYGANVFGNILQNETTHQSMVLTLLQARNIADPRSAEVGVFKNQELQQLYNKLIQQGNQSAQEAYKVGVAIEEKDIADISAQLATATDQDVITTLESLRDASENHLRAFNRQL